MDHEEIRTIIEESLTKHLEIEVDKMNDDYYDRRSQRLVIRLKYQGEVISQTSISITEGGK